MVEPVINHLKTLTEIPLGVYANIGDPNYKADPKHKENDPMKRTVSPDELPQVCAEVEINGR